VDKGHRVMTTNAAAEEFLGSVSGNLSPVIGEFDFVVEKFQELALRSFVVFLVIGNFKIKILSQRDHLEYRLGPLAAPNEVEDKVNGVRMWFFPETIRDFLRGRAPVCENEVFGKPGLDGPEDSLAEFAQTVSSMLVDLQDLLGPKSFGSKRGELDAYELERSAQISEISRRRYLHTS